VPIPDPLALPPIDDGGQESQVLISQATPVEPPSQQIIEITEPILLADKSVPDSKNPEANGPVHPTADTMADTLTEAGVETLQERLRLVETRFAGMFNRVSSAECEFTPFRRRVGFLQEDSG
jgi:hypothetical protein